jgi:hypothetical protein
MNAADVADGGGRSLVADAAQRREDLSGHRRARIPTGACNRPRAAPRDWLRPPGPPQSAGLVWLVMVGWVSRVDEEAGTAPSDHVGIQAHDQSGPPGRTVRIGEAVWEDCWQARHWQHGMTRNATGTRTGCLGTERGGCALRPRSRHWPGPTLSPPGRGRSPATGCTDPGTANSTPPCTPSRAPGSATIPRPARTPPAAPPKASPRRDVKRCRKRSIARQLFKLLERNDQPGVEIIRAA